MFTKATRRKTAPKIAFTGVSGAGKTYSSLLFARGYVGQNGRIAFIDTENGSAQLYSNLTDFDVCDLRPRQVASGGVKNSSFVWSDFLNPIRFSIENGYDALIIDSASSIWEGTLDLKNRIDASGGNSFTNWGQAKQTYNVVKDLILQSPIPIFSCLRSKIAYAVEQNDKGKSIPRKIGLEPISATDAEYDFSIVFNVARNHLATVSKSRCNEFTDEFNEQITEATGARFRAWVDNLS